MTSLVAEHRDHQVGCAVEHLRSIEEIGRRIDEAAKANHARDLVEVAERGFDLRQQIDCAATRRSVTLFDGDTGAELAFRDQLAFGVDADLPRDKQQIPGADEADIIRDRACGFMQDDALRREFLFNSSCHICPQICCVE